MTATAQAQAQAARLLAASGKMKLSELERYEAAAGLVEIDGFPTLAPDALHGLAGEIVRAIEPHSEADPVAILVQTLIAAGNAAGRGPHALAERDRHGVNIFGVLVAQSSKGRKGTSLGHVRSLAALAAPEWAGTRVLSGLSSGEGLIHAVRDRREVEGKDGEVVVVDAGVADKRLQVVEPEFAKVLRVAAREGSTLSPTIRESWDSGNLAILTKNTPERATGAHVSIIGHVTAEELRRYLSATETANGFANRFMFFAVKRSKILPEGGVLRDSDLAPFARRLEGVLAFAQVDRLYERDDEARALWRAVYPKLSAGAPGLVGAVTGRAEAQVLRLSTLYALLDRADVVRVEHLRAALALWAHAEASAAFIFGESLGDPFADEILRVLGDRPQGMTRTEVSNHFNNHQTDRVAAAILTLTSRHLIRIVKSATGGRDVERLFASGRERNERSEIAPCSTVLDSPNSLSSQTEGEGA